MGDKAREYLDQKLVDSFYEKVANDVLNNIQDKGVWAKAFAKAGGDEKKAKALYVDFMVDEMILELQVEAEIKEKQRLEKEEEARVDAWSTFVKDTIKIKRDSTIIRWGVIGIILMSIYVFFNFGLTP